MKISIAMATYNGAQYIQEQLQSFVDQTRQPDELIITDDCSTDETEAIVREFAKAAPFTVAFHRNEKNLGYCGNFNAALMKTTGDLVFLSDQDDVWFPEKIEHMLGIAEHTPQALVVMNDAALTDGELNEVGLTKAGQIRSAGLSMESFVMGCCCAVRRELLDLCMPIPEEVKGHDNWIVQFADGLNAKVVNPEILQYYRRHESNESQFLANRTNKVTRTRAQLEKFKSVFKQDGVVARELQLQQLQIFENGVARAIALAPGRYTEQLMELEVHCRERVTLSEERLTVLKQPLHMRIASVGRLLVRGGYSNANGLSSAIRDIFG